MFNNNSPFQERKNNIEKSIGLDIEKSEHKDHKYIRKEGDKYIYENAFVKTPHGHGKVISVQRHPLDIHHIKKVKVKVNDTEHELNPSDVHPHINEFDENDKVELSKLFELSKKFKDQHILGFKDMSDIERIRANVKGLLHENPGRRAYNRRAVQEGPGGITNNLEKEKALQEMNSIFEKLGPKIDKYINHRNEAYNQEKVHRSIKDRNNTDWSGMKDTGSLD